jgi:hypothetical protein
MIDVTTAGEPGILRGLVWCVRRLAERIHGAVPADGLDLTLRTVPQQGPDLSWSLHVGQADDDPGAAVPLAAGMTPGEPAKLAEHFLSFTQAMVVSACAVRPQSVRALARACGLKAPTTRLKLLLHQLVDRGVLRVTPDGYAVTDALFACVAEATLKRG